MAETVQETNARDQVQVPEPNRSAPVRARDPMIRFVGVGGDENGVCTQCNSRGIAGHFCVPCCILADLVMLACPECQDVGPMGRRCEECAITEYGEELIRASCPICNREGDRGCLCSDCEDAGVLYE